MAPQDLWDKKETKVEMELMVCRVDLARLVIRDHQVKMDPLAYGDHLAFLGVQLLFLKSR